MRAVLASLTLWMVAMVAATALPAVAGPNDDQQLASVNRRLSALTAQPAADTPKPAHVVMNPTLPATTARPGVAPMPAFLSQPQVMRMIANFRSVDRLMHYHSRGLDANFWGVFNHGKGLSIKFSRSF